MTLRERFDFAILVSVFSSFVGASVIQFGFSSMYLCFSPRLQYQHVLRSQFTMDGKSDLQLYVSQSDRSHTVDVLVSIRLLG
jgi:hypothetical protein